MRRSLILLFLLIAVAGGCRKGPGSDAVERRLQVDLDQRFGEGTLVVEDLDRRGSYPFTVEGDDRDRLLTYYDATLTFGRPYELVGWEDPNVGSLITILGATGRGVQGVSAGGNVAGDRLEVHGAVAWVRGDDGWEDAAFAPETEGVASHPDSEEPEPYRKRLAELEVLGKRLVRKGMRGAAANLEWELTRIHTEHAMLLALEEGRVAVLSGEPGGAYHPAGLHLAEALSRQGIDAEAFPTAGTRENLALLRPLGANAFALAQSDLAWQAWKGDGAFEAPFQGLRAVGALYPEAIHVLVPADSEIETLGDLRGKRISAGVFNTGSVINAVQLFRAAGWQWNWQRDGLSMPLSEAPAAFAAGTLDALVVTTAFPSPVVRRIAAIRPVRLLSVPPEVLEKLSGTAPQIVPLRIPAGTYADQEDPVATAGVTALLVTRQETPDDLVRQVMELVWGAPAALSGAGAAGSMVSRSKRTVGVRIPFHGAATP
jgi:TRAP transporter TAXI family solute receptor